MMKDLRLGFQDIWLLKRIKSMDETEYLLSNENNKEVLLRSIAENEKHKESMTDVNYVISLLQNMDKYELDGIRCECDYLIENILNSYSNS